MTDVIMSTEEFARWKYGVDKPTAAQRNSITRMCADNTIKHAQKIGKSWHINCSREWPEIFPPESEQAQPDPATALGALLVEVGQLLMNRGTNDSQNKSGAASLQR